jgi:hypothetical protein
VLRHRARHAEWYLETDIRPQLVEIAGDPDGAHRLVMRGSAAFDPTTIAGGGRLGDGRWVVHLHADLFGMLRMSPAVVETGTAPTPLVALWSRKPAQLLTPHVTEKSRLVFRVGRPPRPATKHALARARDVRQTHTGALQATIDLATTAAGPPTRHYVILRGGPPSLGPPWRRNRAARAALVAAFAKPTTSTAAGGDAG